MNNLRKVSLVFGFALLYMADASASRTTFFGEFIKNPSRIGAVLPSSYSVSNELTRFLNNTTRGVKILEVGAGEGAVTATIVSKLRPSDSLDVIEINPALCDILKKRFNNITNVTIGCICITDWHPSYKYDVIISTLPFSAFKSDYVRTIVDALRKLLVPGGIWSYVEYIGALRLRKLFANEGNYADIVQKNKLLADLRKEFGINTAKVWLNVPPTYIHHLRFGSQI